MKRINLFSLFVVLTLLLLAASACQNQETSTPNEPEPTEEITEEPTEELTEPPTEEPTEELTAEPTEPPPEPTPPPIEPPVGEYITPFAPGDDFMITYIDMVGLTEGWAIAGTSDPGDHILITDDGGYTWRDVSPPEVAPEGGSGIEAIGVFLDQDTAWVTYAYADFFGIPDAPIVWFTDDGGQLWQVKGFLDTNALAAEFYLPIHFFFVDENNGWFMTAIGAGMMKEYFGLYHTEDGGFTWNLIVDPYSDDVGMMSCPKTGMVFADANTGWVTRDCAGLMDGAHFFLTEDGGLTWEKVNLEPPASDPDAFNLPNGCYTHSPQFFSAENGILGVSCKNYDTDQETHYIYTTEDGGATWEINTYPSGELHFISFLQGYAASGDHIYQTLDGGETWDYKITLYWDSGQFNFLNTEIGWAVARNPDGVGLVKITDGGGTLELIEPEIVE
jgi:photosystem II stability/assembly factor-like uncharacterized protein